MCIAFRFKFHTVCPVGEHVKPHRCGVYIPAFLPLNGCSPDSGKPFGRKAELNAARQDWFGVSLMACTEAAVRRHTRTGCCWSP